MVVIAWKALAGLDISRVAQSWRKKRSSGRAESRDFAAVCSVDCDFFQQHYELYPNNHRLMCKFVEAARYRQVSTSCSKLEIQIQFIET